MNKNDTAFFAQRIRSQYTTPETTEVDLLRKLDKKVHMPANVFGYAYGTASALIAGAGMSLVMTEFGSLLGSLAMPLGIGIGILGILLALSTYPIYCAILNSRKNRFKDEILMLSERILADQEEK